MRKKTIFGTLVIIAVLVVSCIPIGVSDLAPYEPPEGSTCWIVTDDVVDSEKQEHDFYGDRDEEVIDDHTQEWYIDCTPFESRPISDLGYWIDTTVDCRAVSSGDNVILYVTTWAYSEESEYLTERVSWTIINGNFSRVPYFKVRVVWSGYGFGTPHDETVIVDVDDAFIDRIELGWMQDLWMELTYAGTKCPGQKEYWVETDYDTYAGKEYKNVTFQKKNYMGEASISPNEGNPHNLTWWTDKQEEEVPISTYGWHINTKALVWVEEVGLNDLKVCVKVYGESNYNPEQINWTIGNAKDAPDPYFNIIIDTDGQGNDWDMNIRLNDEDQFKEIGSIEDPIWLELVFYEE